MNFGFSTFSFKKEKNEKEKREKGPEEEETEQKERLAREAWWKSGEDRSSYSCLAHSPSLALLSHAVTNEREISNVF